MDRIAINEALMNVRRRHGDGQVLLDDVAESARGLRVVPEHEIMSEVLVPRLACRFQYFSFGLGQIVGGADPQG